MSRMKRMIALLTIGLMASGSIGNELEAQDYVTSTGGCGYQDSISSPSLTPYIALATVVVIAIVAVAVRHHHGSHGHCH